MWGFFKKTAPKQWSTIGIQYIDAGGARTSRVITVGVIRNNDDGSNTVVAFCHLRQAMRDFRVDRMCGAFDPETGNTFRQFTIGAAPDECRKLALAAQASGELNAPFRTIAEVVAAYHDRLEHHGWTVRTRSETWGEFLDLHRPYRRGAGILKSPTITLGYEPFFVEDLCLDSAAPQSVMSGARKRPWALTVTGREVAMFFELESAVAAFDDVAFSKEPIKFL